MHLRPQLRRNPKSPQLQVIRSRLNPFNPPNCPHRQPGRQPYDHHRSQQQSVEQGFQSIRCHNSCSGQQVPGLNCSDYRRCEQSNIRKWPGTPGMVPAETKEVGPKKDGKNMWGKNIPAPPSLFPYFCPTYFCQQIRTQLGTRLPRGDHLEQLEVIPICRTALLVVGEEDGGAASGCSGRELKAVAGEGRFG